MTKPKIDRERLEWIVLEAYYQHIESPFHSILDAPPDARYCPQIEIRRRRRGMLNRIAAIEALFACDAEDFDKEKALANLREMHPFDLADFQEMLDELEALIIQVRAEKTVTVEEMEGEAERLLWIPPER